MPDTQKIWWKKALSRGFDPHARPLLILDIYVEDGKRTGCPSKKQDEADEVIAIVSKDRQGSELSVEQIAERLGNRICAKTVWKILREAGLNKTKPTRKPGLSETMRKARLEWCLAHQSWSLEDWKHVIWSDETSVVLCVRRGGYRVWRKPDQSVNKTAIRERWKGYSEFMFWACFSYDHKGPCHVWRVETPSERKQAEEEIEKLNAQNEPLIRAKWEADEAMRYAAAYEKNSRIARKWKWKWSEKKGKLVRKAGHGGVDWYRY